MKKLLGLAVVVALVGGLLWGWQSPYFALYQIDQGLEAKDPVRVERYVDLEALAKASAELVGALASEQLGVGGNDVGSFVLDALVGAVAKSIGDAASVQGAMAVRRAIQQGRVSRGLGPFEVYGDWKAFGGIQSFDKTALVDLNGTCNGNEATVRAVFEQRDGPTFGYPKKWVLTGIDAASVKVLARQCRAKG